MFCYHCQEAKKNVACDTAGICGKKADVSSLHDLLTHVLKGLAWYGTKAAELNIHDTNINHFTARALYSMVTNVNFDRSVFVQLIAETVQRREYLKHLILNQQSDFNVLNLDEITWYYNRIDLKAFVNKGESVGVMVAGELSSLATDKRAAKEMLIYAAKGLGALIERIQMMESLDNTYYIHLYKVVTYTLDVNSTIDDLLKMNFSCGQQALQLMAILETLNTQRFGQPEPTTVHLDTWDKPGIIVSGCDFQDLQDLLEQSIGSGIDIYTHGDLITAHSYPAFKKYFNLVANYGGAWQEQKTQFGKFNGPVLITSNSFQQPKKGYIDKTYTTGMVGWSDIKHIDKGKTHQAKNFSAIIEQAKNCEPPTRLKEGHTLVGYGRKVLMALVDTIATNINSGDIQHIVVIAGYDGRHKERRYYTQLVQALSDKTLIITTGDTKYRFYDLKLGKIKGIPRYLDVGQGHDFHIIIDFIKQLQQKMTLNSITDVPVSYNIAWYEQHTILMMLALFSEGIKNIRIGPTLPPFFSTGILDKLEQDFNIKSIHTPEEDSVVILEGIR